MRYIVVNIDKQQYFRPVELGAPHGSTHFSVAEGQSPYDRPWLVFLAHLIESRPDGDRVVMADRLGRWYGAWAGDRVVIVRGDDQSGNFLPEDLQALKALGTDVKDYKFLRENYKDLTDDLKRVWPEIDWLHGSRYERLTQPQDDDWLTEEIAKERLDFARAKGGDFHRGYLSWLLERPRLRPEVRDLVKKEFARLNRPAALQGALVRSPCEEGIRPTD